MMTQKVSLLAVRITAIYALIGVLWIILSDSILSYVLNNTKLAIDYEAAKISMFIIITAILLYTLITTHTRALIASEKTVFQQNVQMLATYEQLLATEEQLQQQLDELIHSEEKLSRRNECLDTLHEASQAPLEDAALDGFFLKIVRRMMDICKAQYGFIYVPDERGEYLLTKVAEGFPPGQAAPRVAKHTGVAGRAWASGQTAIVNNYHEWSGRLLHPQYDHLRTVIGIPLCLGEEVIGVFSMNYIHVHPFEKDELQMLESFAELAALIMGNHRLYKALQSSQLRNQALVDALPDSIFQLDAQGKVLDYKKGKDFNLLTDIQRGKKVTEFLPAELAVQVMDKIEKAIAEGCPQVFEYKMWAHYHEVRIIASGEAEVIAIVRDITSRKEMEEKLSYQALHDRVTGVHNRVYFEERLHELTASGQMDMGIVVCDIDGLKLVNDTFGHQAGDELIISVVHIIKTCFADLGIVARIGGDEFAVIVQTADFDQVTERCLKVREAVREFSDNSKVPVSISLGSSRRTALTQSMYEVFKQADDNMYREKLHSSQSVRSSIVQTLGKALEVRDFVTGGHASRMQELIVQLAAAAGGQEGRLADLRLFGHFHDIGKVGIPDEILFKPDRLTADEYSVIKRHCEIGYRIAQSSGDLAPIADWILKHQEWWNGQGYPLGLKGEDIPLACRMLAIVDAYDAMTNDRPYRKAISAQAAMEEIERCAFTQFDPHLVEIFKGVVNQETAVGMGGPAF